jgi:hypothetical protein
VAGFFVCKKIMSDFTNVYLPMNGLVRCGMASNLICCAGVEEESAVNERLDLGGQAKAIHSEG